ncbi:MAG: hypothetical protein AAFN27_05160 [Pseudomonadota bacterium]
MSSAPIEGAAITTGIRTINRDEMTSPIPLPVADPNVLALHGYPGTPAAT